MCPQILPGPQSKGGNTPKNKPLKPVKNSRDFDFINKKGKRFQGRFVRLVLLQHKPNEGELKPSRLGITISKKIHKHAVIRNRFRRRVKELYRTNLKALFTGYDMHVIARPGCYEANSAELKDDIMRLIRNISKSPSK